MRTIAFIDDCTIFRTSLATMIESRFPETIVRHYSNGKDFVDHLALEAYTPSLVLMDISMPVMNGYDTTKWLKARYSHTPVIILSAISKEEGIMKMLELGISGFVSKGVGLTDLLEGINQGLNGDTYFNIGSGYYVIDGILYRNGRKVRSRGNWLTPKEEKVLGLIGEAKSYDEIARELQVDPRTIESHKTNISRKTGYKTRHELALHAVQMGLAFILSV